MRRWKWIGLCALPVALCCTAAADTLLSNDEIEVRRLGIPDTGIVEGVSQSAPLQTFNGPALDRVRAEASQQNWAAADQNLQHLRAEFPDWAPPEDLIQTIEQGLKGQALRAAFAEERWHDVLRLTGDDETYCPDTPQFWAISKAFAETGRLDDVSALLQRTLSACGTPSDKLAIVDRAGELLPLGHLIAFQDRVARQLTALGHDRLTASVHRAEREHAIAEQDWGELARLARAHGVREATLQAAWGLLIDDAAAARAEFEFALSLAFDVEADYGVALAAYEDGDHRPALALSHDGQDGRYRAERAELSAYARLQEADRLIAAGAYDEADQLISEARLLSDNTAVHAQNLKSSLSLARADAAYRAGNFDAAILFARKAAQAATLQEAARGRIAWSLYQKGEDQAAYDAFLALYQATNTVEAADGLVFAAGRMDVLDQLIPIAAARSGPLLNRLKSEAARSALQRKDYLIAQKIAPEPMAQLVGVERPYIRQSVSVRSNDGAAGEGRVEAQIARTSAGLMRGPSHIEMGLIAISMDAHSGSDPARSFAEQSTVPFIKIDREGEVALSAQLSATPISGPVPSAVLAEAAVQHLGGDQRARAAIFKRSVDESLTSAFGRVDTDTRETWGRVVETGLEASFITVATDDLSLQIDTAFSQLEGHNIENNQHIKAGASMVKSFAAEGHDYLSAGPFYQYQSFDKNTNFHSAEHGGYFSPQSYHRAGLGIYGQTADLRNWLLRYEASGAIEKSQTDAAPRRPLSEPDGEQFSASAGTSFAGATRVEFSRKLNKGWTLTAGASAIVSTAFNEVQAGVAVKYVLGGKASVTTRDFKPGLFSRDIL